MAEHEDPRTGSRTTLWLVFVVSAPMLYVLSSGPVFWILGHIDFGLPNWVEIAIGIFYAPLGWAAEQFEWFGSLLDWYLELFH